MIGTLHHPLAATATAKPVTPAIATITSPWAWRKLRSLGTSANTRASAPANQAQPSLRDFVRVLFVSLICRASTRLRPDAESSALRETFYPSVAPGD